MKTKRLLWFGLAALGLTTALTTVSVLATSCSQSANPYWPDTSINVKINSTDYQYTFYNQQKDGFKITTKDGKTKTLGQLQSEINDFKGSDGKLLWDDNKESSSQITSDTKFNEYKNLIDELNYASISSQVFSYLYTLYSNVVKVLSQTPLMLTNPNVNSYSNVSQFYDKITDTTSKEFIIGLLQGVGLAKHRYVIGIKNVNIEFDPIDPPLEAPATKYEHAQADKYKRSITVSKFEMEFSWYVEEKTGGKWIENIDQVNNALVDSDIKLLEQNCQTNKVLNKSYMVDLSGIKPQFSLVPSYRKFKDETLFSGIYVPTSPLIKNPNHEGTADENSWIKDPNGFPFTILSFNPQQMKYLFENFSCNDLSGNKNNHNNNVWFFWDTYLFIWKIGYFNSHPNENPYDENAPIKQALSDLETYKFNGKKSDKWEELKVKPEYTSGIDSIYTNIIKPITGK